MDINKIVELFYSNLSLKDIEKIYSIDQRKVRKIWRDDVGIENVKNRSKKIKTIYSEKRSLSKATVKSIYNLIENGYNTCSVAKQLNISTSVVNKYLKKNPKLLEMVKVKNLIIYRENMKNLRKSGRHKTLDSNKIEEVIKYFNTNHFLYEIAEKCNICITSVVNIFISCFGKKNYLKRVSRIKPLQIKKSFQGLIKAGKLGSRPELMFYNILKNNLKAFIKHHDLDIMPPFEIDITIPEHKIAIFWDGIGHFKPIFGEKIFKQVVYRDKYKRKQLEKMEWKWFEVIDLRNKWSEIQIKEQLDIFLKRFPGVL